MSNLHAPIHYLFAVAGIGIGFVHPVSGMVVFAGALISGAVLHALDQSHCRSSKALIDELAAIVNINAAKLEENVLRTNQIDNVLAMKTGTGISFR